jgi:hypothetical protein
VAGDAADWFYRLLVRRKKGTVNKDTMWRAKVSAELQEEKCKR